MTSKKSKEGGAIRQPEAKTLLTDLRQLIAEARQDVARQVNSALVMLYWRIGQRIRRISSRKSGRSMESGLSPQ